MYARERALEYAKLLKTRTRKPCDGNTCVISYEPIQDGHAIVIDKQTYDVENLYKWIIMHPNKQTIPYNQRECSPAELACIIKKQGQVAEDSRDIEREQQCVKKHATVSSEKQEFDANLLGHDDMTIAKELVEIAIETAVALYDKSIHKHQVFVKDNNNEIICVLFAQYNEYDSAVVRTIYNKSTNKIIVKFNRVVFPRCLAQYIQQTPEKYMEHVSRQMIGKGYALLSMANGGSAKYKFKGRSYSVHVGKRGGHFINVRGKRVYIKV